MTGERRYRGSRSFPIPVWNGIFEHADRIDEALWEFVWCIDAITKEVNGVGMVLGGAPVKLQRISEDLAARDAETVRRHLKKLEANHYIRMRRTPYGQVIEVLNSKKFGIWRRKEKLQNEVSPVAKKPQNAVSHAAEKPQTEERKPIAECEKPQIAASKEDSAVTQQVKTAVLRVGFDSEQKAREQKKIETREKRDRLDRERFIRINTPKGARSP